MKEDHSNESFDRELQASPSNNLLSLTPKGFISRNELKFQSEAIEIVDFSHENHEDLCLGQEVIDFSKGKYANFRQKGLSSLLQISSNLLELDLSSNNLIFFPIELIHLTHLKTLRLDYNEIKAISNDIDRLSNLEFLSISNNLLSNLPMNFAKLRNIKVLNIGKNLITDLQPISSLKTVETLYIYGNLFTEIPVSFANLHNLKEFAIEWLKYAEPGISPIIKRPQNNKIFEKFFNFLMNKKEKTVEFFEFLRFFSTEKLDFLQKDAKGRTFLHNAAVYEELGVLTAISNKFPKLLNIVDKDLQTPLTLSILEEKFRSVEHIIELGADCLAGGGIFGSSLHLAVSKLNVKIVEKLLEKLGCQNNRKINQDFDKNSPFHILFSIFAKDSKNAEKIARKLLNFGLDPNLKNKELYTALHIAVKKNQVMGLKFAMEFNKTHKSRLFKGEMEKNEQKGYHLSDLAKKGINFTPEKKGFGLIKKNLDVSTKQITYIQTAHPERNQNVASKSCEFSKKTFEMMKNDEECERDFCESAKFEQIKRNIEPRNGFLKDLNSPIKNVCLTKNNLNNNEMINSVDLEKNGGLPKIQADLTFNMTKKGGNAKWSLAHLASFLGNLEILNLLDDYNFDFFQETASRQDPLKVSYQSIVVIKTIRKAQKHWILRNIIRKKEKTLEFIENINDSEDTIAKNMRKKQLVFRNNGEHLLSRVTRKSKKTIEEIEENCEDMEEYRSEENVTQKMLNKSSDIANLSDREQSIKKTKKKKDTNEKEKDEIFNFKRGDIGDLQVFNEEGGFGLEIERVYKIMNGEECGFVEKMLGFLYLEMMKLKASGVFLRYTSIRLPINVFLLNEAKINGKKAGNVANWIEKIIYEEMMNEIIKGFKGSANVEENNKEKNQNGNIKFKGFNEEIKFIRKNNDRFYKCLNSLLLLVNKMADNNELLTFYTENCNNLKLPKILLYELIENSLKKNNNGKGKKSRHGPTKSMNNVSVIINNNFYITSASNQKDPKKKKQSLSFWGISPERLENKENFTSKPYFLI